ncbi:type II secretion system F family protein [Actinocatenispora rupis]|uniref:type II secretion system F family protein n=1 Tax=Actinocatenispora rupis TaxID=519421 RepID=UPI001EF2B9D1|nr:type II secretion system F family protein [Actinocatenispora rupis]
MSLLTRLGLPRPVVRRDLALLNADVAAHLAEQATLTIAGLVLAPLLATLAGLGVTVSVIAAVAGAAGGFLLVDRQARQRAGSRRRELRSTLSAYLDLVVLAADGGAGVDQALTDSADVCRGWAAGQIRAALNTARLTRTSPWSALHELGQRVGVPELVELAATTALAGTEGARVRTSLSARAAALRTRQLADAEQVANRATERMTLPMFLLAAGFVLLIAFPALAGIAGIGTGLP